MAQRYEYAISPGFGIPSPTNVQDIIKHAPTTIPDQGVPLGSVRRRTADGKVHSHGARDIEWVWTAGMSWPDFETYILYVYGDFNTENADVTIVTRQRNNLYSQFNAIAILPLEGEHYQRREGGKVFNLHQPLRIVSGPSEFSYEFSYEFTI